MIRRWLKRRERKARRAKQWAELTAMGYQVIDAKGEAYSGRSFLAYFVRTPNGETLDNFGTGYGHFTYAYEAAIQHNVRAKSESRPSEPVAS